jgi:hypothetical protein
VTWDESQVSVGGLLALDQVLENLGRVEHFWDFDRLVEDGVPGRSGDHGISLLFAGFLGLGFM